MLIIKFTNLTHVVNNCVFFVILIKRSFKNHIKEILKPIVYFQLEE